MKGLVLRLGLSTLLISPSTLAGTMGSFDLERHGGWGWVGTVSAGPVWADDILENNTFFLTPEIEKTYLSNESIPAIFFGEIFIGRDKYWTQTIDTHLGLAFAATNDARMEGLILDDADPIFTNYSYTYKIKHMHLALKGKVLADWEWFLPWLSASVGIGFNNAHSYCNTPLIFEALPNPNFVSHTQTSFTYTLGIGIQKAMSPHWQIGFGYEFADWGSSSLGPAEGQTIGKGISLDHFYTNGLIFNLTYLT